MEAKLQRRIQRYGWDLAAADYEPLWHAQLAAAHAELMARAALMAGERVLDVACGTGLVAFDAARAVGPGGRVVGIDVSDAMIETARSTGRARGVANASFARMDAEQLGLPGASFDVAICALGLMYMPRPEQAMREMRRVLRPGGRFVGLVWGERARCAWSALFPIVDAEVASDVCPLFFRLGAPGELARLCARAQFDAVEQRRIAATLDYAGADEACDAAFVGGPVALAWSRFDDEARTRVRARYLQAIDVWRHDDGYRLPSEFVIVSAAARNDECVTDKGV
jgi:ubiquinone/menaquinone biosynthesis C-methylase UbiE